MTKGMPPVQEAEPVTKAEVVVSVPAVNDSSEGLARMISDLTPLANRVRYNASILMLFSVFFMSTPEGLFGLIAAMGVLCCAAPGALGTAYAARCTRIMATVSAAFSLMHVMCLAVFMFAVVPEMPRAFHHACAEVHEHHPHAPPLEAAKMMPLPAPGADVEPPPGAASHFMGHLFVRSFVVEGGDAAPAPPVSAFVATVATSASRRLQEWAPETFPATEPPCARAERVFTQAAPMFICAALLVEMCLFVAAIRLARSAAHLILVARKQGANGI